MKIYQCLYKSCRFEMAARKRPKKCPACGRVSHEDMLKKTEPVEQGPTIFRIGGKVVENVKSWIKEVVS